MGSSQSTPLVKGIKTALSDDSELFAFPGDALYQLHDVKPYNQARPCKPSAVTYPKTAEQVAAIVKCAVEAGKKVQARSGGHSYANYCMFLSYLILLPSPNHIYMNIDGCSQAQALAAQTAQSSST